MELSNKALVQYAIIKNCIKYYRKYISREISLNLYDAYYDAHSVWPLDIWRIFLLHFEKHIAIQDIILQYKYNIRCLKLLLILTLQLKFNFNLVSYCSKRL